MSAGSIDNVKKIIHLIELFDSLGLVKNHEMLLGSIIFNNRKEICSCKDGVRKSLIIRILDIGLKCNSNKLSDYIDIFFSEDLAFLPSDTIIDFSDFLILTKRRKLTVGALEEIKNAINIDGRDVWRAVLSKMIRWPSTDAPESLKSLIFPFCDEIGVLSSFGYTVGKHGKPSQERFKILDLVLSESLEDAGFGSSYLNEWGRPESITRLIKTAKTIAALCRNAKRSEFDYHQAITDWQNDLAYLKEKYYDKLSGDPKENWPET